MLNTDAKRTGISGVLDWLFPSVCLVCNAWLKQGAVCCENCFEKFPLFSALFCGKCRARLGKDRKTCHADFPYLLGAATDYRHPGIRALVGALKFKSSLRAAEPLAALLARYAETLSLPQNAVIIPIPLSASRLRERGFNQAELIVRPLASRHNLPLCTDILFRTVYTKPQSEIKDAAARGANVRNCFTVRDAAQIAGKNIILVDDVVTSGATLLEASRALKAAGASRIIALVAAKA